MMRFIGHGILAIAIVPISLWPMERSPLADGPQPVVIELFTSEGCSSCPPADRLLADIVTHAPAGIEILALSEHVDYWDGLGWRDPFSSRQFTDRQNRYAAHFGPDRVYTPQMIVDGSDELVGSDRGALTQALSRARARTTGQIALAWPRPGDLSVAVTGAGAGAEVMLAITEDGLATDVTRGENAGHRLPHVRVVRSLVKIGQTDGAGAFAVNVPAAAKAGWQAASLRATVFVQARGLGVITAAASRPFPAANPLPR
jgi:hypothetical protein